jgi:Family of unknown function (DUF5946)
MRPGLGACPGCGLALPELEAPTHAHLGASPACWALYGQLLVHAYRDDACSRVHRLIVDTYSVQHPGGAEPPAIHSLGLHLTGLALLLERGVGPQQATKLLARICQRQPAFRSLEPPLPNGSITVSDVLAVPPGERAQAVERWARDVWDVWEPHHATARSWIDAGLGERTDDPT